MKNNIKDGVCIDHFPNYNTHFAEQGFLSTDHIATDEILNKLTSNVQETKLEQTEKAFAEYILFKYNKTPEDIKRIAHSMHNFKLKGFESFVIPTKIAVHTDYRDRGVTFLRVQDFGGEIRIVKYWE